MAPPPRLRHLWHFHPKWQWQQCLVTGATASLSPHASIGRGGLLVPSESWNEVPTHLPISLSVLPVTVLIGYRQDSGVVPWAFLADGQWEGVYGSNYGAVSTSGADFSGLVNTQTNGPVHDPDGIYYCAITMSGANDLRVSVNGYPVLADTSCTAPSGTITKFRLGSDSSEDNKSNILCKFVAILDRPFTDQELVAASANPWGSLFAPQQRVIITLPAASTFNASSSRWYYEQIGHQAHV